MKGKRLRHLFLIVGIVICIGLAHSIGWRAIGTQVMGLRWWMIPILSLGIGWNLTATAAWRRTLHQRLHRIGWWPLFRIKIAGETINTLTPINFLGGDPFRIYLLKRYYPWTEGAASVVVDRTINSMAILLTVLIGTTMAFWRIPILPMNIRYGLPVVLTIATGFIGFLFAHQRRGLFGFLMHTVKRLRLRREFTRPTVQRFEELDALITDFYHEDRRGFWLALMYHTLGRFLGIVEIYVIGALVEPRFGFVEALILGGLAPIVNFLFTFVPGAIGILEGAYTAALYLLHLPSTIGVTIQLVRRARSLIWIGCGFLALGAHERHKLWGSHLVSSSANNRA